MADQRSQSNPLAKIIGVSGGVFLIIFGIAAIVGPGDPIIYGVFTLAGILLGAVGFLLLKPRG